MSEKIRKHIILYGRVQGVGFRYYSVYKSRQLGLTGWVRNLYDGTVEKTAFSACAEDVPYLLGCISSAYRTKSGGSGFPYGTQKKKDTHRNRYRYDGLYPVQKTRSDRCGGLY